MNDDFLLVHKSILPSLPPQVIEAREKIQKDGISVTEACKSVNISRSAFYKYKDFVFFPDTSVSKKAILAFKVNDKPGVLTALLAKLSQAKINVLTIHQEMPIQAIAYITMTLDIKNLTLAVEDLVHQLTDMENVRKVNVIAYE